jgi:uncharacterized protein YndB with AHSA1/START domain
MTTTLPYRLERIITIQADRTTVFHFFTDPARWATWWGKGSTIDARPGGALLIHYPDGTEGVGVVVELTAPERIVFTYGYASGKPIPPGSSRITIRLEKEGAGTRLHFTHEFGDQSVRDEHVQGWRFQLSLFANVVLDEVHAGAAASVDGWFAAWAEPDATRRAQAFARVSAPDVKFRDRFSLIDGVDDLVAHTGAAQRFMPGIRMERRGDLRQCQGTAIVDWIWKAEAGDERACGTNVFTFRPDGQIEGVTGFMTLAGERSQS